MQPFLIFKMNLLENYLKSARVQKALTTKPGEEGFSLVELVVVIAVLAILSAVAIPAFNGVQANARASAMKNGLVNGVKECVILSSEGQTTNRADVQSFPGNYTGYTVTGWSGGSLNGTCYNAFADAASPTIDADFWIEMASNGAVTKGCSDGGLPGCTGTSGSAGTW